MNINKHLKRNLSLPLNQRVNIESIPAKVQTSKNYAAKLALLASIHVTIVPQIEAKRKTEKLMDRIGSVSGGLSEGMSASKKQGFVFNLSKYREKFAIGHKAQTETMPELATENSPEFACIVESVKLAEKE
jgi:hypothetical protein